VAAAAVEATSVSAAAPHHPHHHHHHLPCPVVRLVSAHRDLTAAYLVQELCEGGDLQGVLDLQAAKTVELAGLEARAAAGDATAAAVLAAAVEGSEASGGSSPRPGGFPGALPEEMAAAAMAAALRFIAACHDAGVVFGDVKPSNFLLREADQEEAEEAAMEEAAATAAATAATTTTPLARRRRRSAARLLRLQGVDFGTALALPVNGVCSIHHSGSGCACADVAAGDFALLGLSGGGGGSRGSSPAPAVVAAALAGNHNNVGPSSSPPASPSPYARECTPRRGLSGTPVYMAPELVRDRRAGPASDVWAAGAMAYQLLTGRFVFWPELAVEDLARLPPGRVLAEVAAAPLALDHPRTTAHLSPEARGFLSRLLERDPARRISARQALAHPFLQAHGVESVGVVAASSSPQQSPPIVTTR